MHIACKANETNTKNKSFKEARCRCNGEVIVMYLVYRYSLDQAKNVLNVTKWQH